MVHQEKPEKLLHTNFKNPTRVWLDEVKFNAHQVCYFVMVDGVTYDKFVCSWLTFAEQVDVANGYRDALTYG